MPRVHDSLLRPQRKLKLRGNFAVENGEFAITLPVITLSVIQPYTLMK